MSAPALLKQNWVQDTVYLVQFPRPGCIVSQSPFSFKLETWLRITGVKYENVSNEFTKLSARGQIPFIELNGVQIADSNIIIETLKEKFKIAIDNDLSEMQIAQARALFSLIEGSLYWIYIYSRGKDSTWFTTEQGWQGQITGVKKFIFDYFINERIRKKLWNMCYVQGIGRYTVEEVEKIAEKDLKALSVLLGDKPYFLGSSKPHTLDTVAFAHLSQLYFTPQCSENFKKFLVEQTPNLVEFINRIKGEYWKDWDEILRTHEMNTHLVAAVAAQPQPST